jgi:hypothetical protein
VFWLWLPWWGPLKKPTLQPTTPLIRSFGCLFTFYYYEVRPFQPKCTRLRPLPSPCVLLRLHLRPFFCLRPHLRPVASALASCCVCACVRFVACVLLRMHLRPVASACVQVVPLAPVCVCLRPFQCLRPFCLVFWLWLPWWGPLKKPTLQPTTPLIRSFGCLFTFDYYEVRPFQPQCTRLRPFALRSFALRSFCWLRLHLRPRASHLAACCVFTCVHVPLTPCGLLRLHLRPFGLLPFCCLRPVVYACVQVRLLASVCVCLRPFHCLRPFCLESWLWLLWWGPLEKPTLQPTTPPYPFIWLSFYL